MSVRKVSPFAIVAVLSLAGCGHWSPGPITAPAHLAAGDRSMLAGEWEYEDGGAVSLRLDAQGNGTYAFKEGRFETLEFDGRTWVGKWYQKENDREGGFLVKLSADYGEGEGIWWYERIGTDTAPTEKGGAFHLSRTTSVTNLRDTPPAP